MGKLFGHGGILSKIDHEINRGIGKANELGEKIFGDNSFYIGTNGVAYGEPAEQIISSKLPNGGIGKPRPKSGYSRTTAATAKDIAQGGMTKDEVIEFNMKHPNETAIRSE